MLRSMLLKFLYLSLVILTIPFSFADEYRPAYLELKQTSPDVFNMLWKVPAKGNNQRLALYVKMLNDVTVVDAERSSFVGGAFISHSILQRSGGLTGVLVTIDGLEKVSTDVLLRVQRLDGTKQVVRLTSTKTSVVITESPTTIEVAKTYLMFGIEHILNGFDHLLFVACLIFIAGTWRRILVTVTGFTLAHSVTLSLAGLELVRLPVPPIEATIALSIVFLAREIALDRRNTLTWRYPIAVSASFGLLHGFGFASALSDIGLPQTEIPAALLAFNVGVEIGQIVFVAGLLLMFWLINQSLKITSFNSINWLGTIEKPIAYSVGGITMFWTLERVSGFWI